MLLEDQVAIITGAGGGIGKAIASRFISEGASVVIAEVNEDSGQATADELGEKAMFIPTDVAKIDTIHAAVDMAVTTFGKLTVLVNNAGLNFVKSVFDTSLEDWDNVINVDLRGTFFGCKFAAKQFVKQGGGGCIVNISSVHSIATLSGAGPYAAAKGGVTQLTKALAVELGDHNIRVNAVAPGLTNTKIWQDIQAAGTGSEEIVNFWNQQIALRRAGEPDEVAAFVTWLCSDQAQYITGANLVIDGGMTAMLTALEE